VFPWGQPELDLTFTCPHCGQQYHNEYNRVEVCGCRQAEQARAEQRQRDATFNQQHQPALVDWVQIRRDRKIGKH
jgi:hypothetical protein